MFNNHCRFDLWAPNHRDKVENVAFSAFAFHQQMIEDYINCLSRTPDPNDFSYQHQAEIYSGLSLDDCTTDELHYIEKEVARKWTG